MVGGADGVGQFRGRQVGRPAKIATGDRRDSFSALGGVEFGAGSGERLRLGDRAGFAVDTLALADCNCAPDEATAGLTAWGV